MRIDNEKARYLKLLIIITVPVILKEADLDFYAEKTTKAKLLFLTICNLNQL